MDSSDFQLSPVLRTVIDRVGGLLAAGQTAEAQAQLLGIWSSYCDGLEDSAICSWSHQMLVNLGFSTDGEDEWSRFPDPLTIYRDGHVGVCWTANRLVAEKSASGDEIRVTAVPKADVVAYITGYGEAEVLLAEARLQPRSRQRRVDHRVLTTTSASAERSIYPCA